VADYEDPGWRAAIRGVGWFLFPIAQIWSPGRTSAEDELISLRRAYVGIVDSLFLFLVAFTFISPWDGGSEGWIPIAVVAIGTYCLVAVLLLSRRPLDTQSPRHLASSYRAMFFIGVGMATSAALFGICGIFIGGSLWIYLISLPFALGGLAIIAPTRANIERKQAQIQTLGSPLSLGQALLAPSEPLAPLTGTRAPGIARLRLATYVAIVAVALLGLGIRALWPNFDPVVIMLPAFGLFIGVALVSAATSITRGVAARRHRQPPEPPPAGTE
jgi:hypothetical protein